MNVFLIGKNQATDELKDIISNINGCELVEDETLVDGSWYLIQNIHADVTAPMNRKERRHGRVY